MSTPKHTPEPWEFSETGEVFGGSVDKPLRLADCDCDREVHHGTAKANAARIVACVNALAGLDPSAVGEVVETILSGCLRSSRRGCMDP